jgi:ATP diphosphatase
MKNLADQPRDRISTLLGVMRALRDPDTGCPWDVDQTFETIAPYTIEEAYEVADAIANGDSDALCDELGDLLLQVVYHAQIGAEAGAFTFEDVVRAITDKMIRRHPHVFGDDEQRGKLPQTGFWEETKAKERAGQTDATGSVLDGVPTALPALKCAVKLQNKAARVNFDWPSGSQVLAKVVEELHELEEAENASDPEQQAEEFGDMLFAIANYARHMKLDPEEALRKANRKFINRFKYIEQAIEKEGKSLRSATLAEMEVLWEKAKACGIK